MKRGIVVLVSILIIFSIVGFAFYFILFDEKSITKIVGKTVRGSVSLEVLGPEYFITIDSPQNTTYFNRTLDLNVSANFEPTIWTYTLESPTRNLIVNESVVFTPNTTIRAIKKSNKLTVFANRSNEISKNRSVVFYVNVPNIAPQIIISNQNILACEGKTLSYFGYALDADADDLNIGLFPATPFFVTPQTSFFTENVTFELFSGTLTKSLARGNKVYTRTLSVSDGENQDSKVLNITVIEINNPPTVENIGSQTVWTRGDSNVFYKQLRVNDSESGNETSGNFTFKIYFSDGQNLFGISNYGVMNFTPNESHIGVHNISVCVTDKNLGSIHPNISLCEDNGMNKTVCQNFSLTVTAENRRPTITSYIPENTTLNVSGNNLITFNIFGYDPDGTIPNTYWYFNGSLKKYDPMKSQSNFSFLFECGTQGTYILEAVVSDGLLNDSIAWQVNVNEIACPSFSPASGGSGTVKSNDLVCEQKWGCGAWSVCQSIREALKSGKIFGEEYRNITEICKKKGLDEDNCGFQTRNCIDTNNCNKNSTNNSLEFQACYFVVNPSCNDGIRNCHSGGCEILTDCGGPCEDCPSCSDGKKNQNEEGIDCGGPCPKKCSEEELFQSNFTYSKQINYFFIILLIFLLILVLIKVIRVILIKREIGKTSKKHYERYWNIKNDKAVILVFTLIAFFSLPFVAGANCIPEYDCGNWTECVDGLQSRICKDKKCGNEEIINRRLCKEDCQPEIQCGDWSSCAYAEKATDILNGKIDFSGYKQRICYDLNGCVNNFLEEEFCGEGYDLNLTFMEECGKNFLVALDPLSQRPVAKINFDSWKSNRLDIIFEQTERKYCDSCYNGYKDNDEEKVDCGGSCKPCYLSNKNYFKELLLISWTVASIFSFLFFREIKLMKREIDYEKTLKKYSSNLNAFK